MTILKQQSLHEQQNDDVSKYLEDLNRLVQPKMIELLIDGTREDNRDAICYQILSGGKRLRPALTLISCKMLGGNYAEALYPAAALEILHNCTLIIDDIIDHSSVRRNKPTTWKQFGSSIASCISMTYAASIFQGGVRTENCRFVIEKIAQTLKCVADGEMLDILFECEGRADEAFVASNRYSQINMDDYVKMIGMKTATLFRASCEIGGLCANGKKEHISALSDYGYHIGMAFQIRDDILDIFGDERTFGKIIGKDILERKMGNIVIIFALQELGTRNALTAALHKEGDHEKDEILAAIDAINETTAKHRASILCDEFIDLCNSNLDLLPQNKELRRLRETAVLVSCRNN